MKINIDNALFNSDILGVFGLKAVQIIITFLIGYILLKILLKIVKRALQKSKLDAALHRFILSAIRIAGYIIIIIMILPVLGVNITAFIAVLGAAGAAIALALKDSLANVAGGIMLLITKPFGQGDLVQIGTTLGTVQEIDILSTSLKTVDNKLVTVPNGLISTSVLTNYNRTDDRRVDCIFCVNYENDMDKARAAVEKVAKECPYLTRDGECSTGVGENGERGFMFEVYVWCRPEHYWDAKYYMEENVKKAFNEAGVAPGGAAMKVTLDK